MNKLIVIVLLLISGRLSAQQNDVSLINSYKDSINSIINTSTGLPGEILTATVSSSRNERAIGMQQTKITFYYYQPEDSVTETNGIVSFFPRYLPPVKITIEYNIAASQNVRIDYYLNGNKLLCDKISDGEYGNFISGYWYKGNDLIKYYGKRSDENNKEVVMTDKFSKAVYNESLLATDRLILYLKLYYDIFKTSQADKN